MDTFENLVGQEKAVSRARTYLQSRQYGTGVVVFGPSGIGKRAFCRVFGAAILCDGDAEVAPCQVCWSCLAFLKKGSHFNFIPLNAPQIANSDVVRDVLNKLKSGPLGSRWLVHIEDVERLVDEAVDVLLKTVEEQKEHKVFFLFSAERIEDVRVTLKSRSTSIRLRPVAASELAKLCQRLSSTFGVVCSEAVQEALVSSSDGLPGRLTELAKGLFAGGEPTVSAVHAVAGTGWMEETVVRWLQLVEKGDLSAVSFLRHTQGSWSQKIVRAPTLLVKLKHFCARASDANSLDVFKLGKLQAAIVAYSVGRGLDLDSVLHQLTADMLAET